MATRGYRTLKVDATLEQAKRAFFVVGDEEVEEVEAAALEFPSAAAIFETTVRLRGKSAHAYLASLHRQRMPGVEKVQSFGGSFYVLTGPLFAAAGRAYWDARPEEYRDFKGRNGLCQQPGCSAAPTSETPVGLLCNGCIRSLGLEAPRIELPAPMSEEEIAHRRAMREIERRTRRWDGVEVPWDRKEPLILRVPYTDDRGHTKPKMVGKVQPVNMAMIEALAAKREDWGDRHTEAPELAFFHAHTPSQRHHQTNSPSPIDTVVCDYLYRVGVEWVVAFERQGEGEGLLRYTPTGRVQSAPEAEYDGRWRRYLSEESWTVVAGVNETLRQNGSRFYSVGRKGEVLIASPFANENTGAILKAGRK